MLLRTEFAIKNIEKKVSSKKYKNLWPKAVLEALDGAIKEKKWQLALKVCFFLILYVYLISGLWVPLLFKFYRLAFLLVLEL